MATAERLLTLLGVLQSRPSSTGGELAARVGLGERTIRNDIARLRDLGYPIEVTTGRGGGYRLGRGGRIRRCSWTTTRPSPWRWRSGC